LNTYTFDKSAVRNKS